MTLKILFVLLILANLGDNISTYLALALPAIEGMLITEANPIAAWIFETMGLVKGLIFEFVLSIGILFWLMGVKNIPYKWKVVIFVGILIPTVYAVINNVKILFLGVFI
jgi:hypothetical protein